MDVPIWAWAGVVALILAMLAVDLFVFHRDAHAVSVREAAITSAVWVALGLGFAIVVAMAWGGTRRASIWRAISSKRACRSTTCSSSLSSSGTSPSPPSTSTECCSGASSGP